MIALLAAVFLVSETPDLPVHGIWATDGEGRVEMAPCEADPAKLCGALIDAPELQEDPDLRDVRNPDEALRDRPLKGVLIVDHFEARGDEWKPGLIYDPEQGMRIRRGHVRLTGADTLEIRGCVTVVCRTQTWTRVDEMEDAVN